MRNSRRLTGKLRRYTNKSTHIYAANLPKVAYLVPNKCIGTALLLNGWIHKLSNEGAGASGRGTNQAKSCDRRDAVWLHGRMWHYWCNIHCTSAIGEVVDG